MISIKIKDPIFTYSAQLINILDFNPTIIGIEKVCAINDDLERIYCVKYGGDPFYLVIDDLKGCFKYSEEKKLGFVIEDQKKRKIYNQIVLVLDFISILEITMLLDLILMILYHQIL